jgi:hypothetical protein
VLAASIRDMIIALIMEVASTSETSVNFYQTKQRNIPEDSYLLLQFMFFLQSKSPRFTAVKTTDKIVFYE